MSVRLPYPLVSYRLELNFVHSNTRFRTPTPTRWWGVTGTENLALCRSHFP